MRKEQQKVTVLHLIIEIMIKWHSVASFTLIFTCILAFVTHFSYMLHNAM